MSKVIKSAHVANLAPLPVHRLRILQLNETGEETGPEIFKPDAEELEKVRESILKETEEMVADLINQAKEQAQVIIAEAHDEAEAILANARQEGENLRTQAFQQGLQEGQKQALAQWEEKISALTAIIRAATENKRRALKEAEELMVELVLAISARILKALPEINPDYLRGQVEAVVEKVLDSEQGILYVAPQAVEQVSGWLDEIIANHPTLRKLRIQPDSSLSPGSVILETQYGRVEAILEEQMQLLAESLKGVMEDELDSEEMALSGVN
ncbi:MULTISPECIES: FliH/SctL family protein [Carboxydocella]|uniref:Flagellar assembly protein FliH n=2 Tax=Carboxydocella TaxID=178898 RepID=A0A1T4PCU0_9FIRM|nr:MULTISPECIES: FliH/SctL family protein [Carboxydocella]AVX20773.1 Flagellar biosynthesis/type III secretory pathway protein FliH [Carboxydocella thermautotrophica]AVX31192.1 Flagellar biosynthesis/type III secretory pathway protein FliH [Carboxydocella thermautotrophica]SJZ88648.1 Flagellar assembly protein FliH [Carboxydocella sporoproducens DSM 16521]GAW28302.1 Flagellar assembly protein FliH [Carboxydocella sp. ULO1]GAW32127.1 Flagellar assembly protein FliH [Carboxydocella sp. JDF658]